MNLVDKIFFRYCIVTIWTMATLVAIAQLPIVFAPFAFSIVLTVDVIVAAFGVLPIFSTAFTVFLRILDFALQIFAVLSVSSTTEILSAGLVAVAAKFMLGALGHKISPPFVSWLVFRLAQRSSSRNIIDFVVGNQNSILRSALPLATRNRVAISTSAALSGAAPLLN